jgi:hypothetical protein
MARPNQSIGQRKGGSSMKRRQWPSANFPHGIQFIFKDYSYDEFITKAPIGNFNTEGEFGEGQTVWQTASTRRAKETDSFVLELPIPKSLTDATGVSIGGFERSFIESFLTTQAASAMKDPLATAKSLGDAIANAAGGAVSGDFSMLGDQADTFKRLVLTLGTSVLGQLGLGEKSIGAVSGSVQNPQSTLYFDGVDLRSFQFSWQVYPANKQEADEIRDIVREVKARILPQVQGLNPTNADTATNQLTQSSLGRAFLKYPSVVLINLLGVDESHYLRFKPCMCKGINIDYADNGSILTVAEGGVPYGISISMDFMELEIQTAEDYGRESGNSLDVAMSSLPPQEEADTDG